MAEPILIRENVADGHVQWLDLERPEKNIVAGTLMELAAYAGGRPLALVWPAEAALLIDIDLPLRNAAQITKALPFALEDSLAGDVEQYHLVWHRPSRSQRIVVAAVGHDAMAACCKRFDEAGLQLNMLLPEPLLLPWQSGQCALMLDGGHGVFRYGDWAGGGGERELSALLLQKLRQGGQAEGEVCLYASGDVETVSGLPDIDQQWAGEIEPLMLYATQWQAAQPLNLLCGAYAAKRQTPGNSKRWRPAAAILMLALLLQLAGQWQWCWRQQQQLQALEAKSQALFRQTFPDVTRLVNLKVQADQQFLALQEQARQQQAGFLPLLYHGGNRLQEAAQLKLQRLQFADANLQIHLLAPDAASVEAYGRRLIEEDGLQADIRAQVVVPAGVEVEIVIHN